MPVLLVVSAIAAIAMAAAVVWMVRPTDRGEVIIRGAIATLLAAAVTTTAGVLTDVEDPAFLLALSLGAAPVAVLLGAAAGEAAPGRRSVARVLVWPGQGSSSRCASSCPRCCTGCAARPNAGSRTSGGGWRCWCRRRPRCCSPGGRTAGAEDRGAGCGSPHPSPCSGSAAAAWLASLEGAVDEYTARILLAAVLAPAGGRPGVAAGRRSPPGADVIRCARFADGVLAGTGGDHPRRRERVAFRGRSSSVRWPVRAAALVFGATRIASAGRAGHWALVVLAATAIGYLAPAISGDTVGLRVLGTDRRVPAAARDLRRRSPPSACVSSTPAWARRAPRPTRGRKNPRLTGGFVVGDTRLELMTSSV